MIRLFSRTFCWVSFPFSSPVGHTVWGGVSNGCASMSRTFGGTGFGGQNTGRGGECAGSGLNRKIQLFELHAWLGFRIITVTDQGEHRMRNNFMPNRLHCEAWFLWLGSVMHPHPLKPESYEKIHDNMCKFHRSNASIFIAIQ